MEDRLLNFALEVNLLIEGVEATALNNMLESEIFPREHAPSTPLEACCLHTYIIC